MQDPRCPKSSNMTNAPSPGPAECAERLNNNKGFQHYVKRCFHVFCNNVVQKAIGSQACFKTTFENTSARKLKKQIFQRILKRAQAAFNKVSKSLQQVPLLCFMFVVVHRCILSCFLNVCSRLFCSHHFLYFLSFSCLFWSVLFCSVLSCSVLYVFYCFCHICSFICFLLLFDVFCCFLLSVPFLSLVFFSCHIFSVLFAAFISGPCLFSPFLAFLFLNFSKDADRAQTLSMYEI